MLFNIPKEIIDCLTNIEKQLNRIIRKFKIKLNKVEDKVTLANSNLSEVYTELKSISDNLSLKKQIVSELPTENIKTNVIYLVPKENATEDDRYDEYIFIPDSDNI